MSRQGGGVALLKALIRSRTQKGPKATNNKSANEGEEGMMLIEARAAIAAQSESLCPRTPDPHADRLASDDGAETADAVQMADADADETVCCEGCSSEMITVGTDYHYTGTCAWCNYCGDRVEALEK